MEISHIFKALLRSKTSYLLMSLQVAITLAVLINALALVKRSQEIIREPTGMDISNIIAISSIPFAQEFNDQGYGDVVLRDDLRLLRNINGVQYATVVNFIPTSMGNNSSLQRQGEEDGVSINAGAFSADEFTLPTLGLELYEGRNFYAQEVFPSAWPGSDKDLPQIIILSKELAQVLFPGESALGKSVILSGAARTVVGVVEKFRGRSALLGNPHHNFLVPGYPSGTKQSSKFLVRTDAGLAKELVADFEQKLLQANSGRDIDEVVLMQDQINTSNNMYAYGGLVLMSISGLLIVTTALGIFGMASFSVTKRTKLIGIRRALGATRLTVLSYFLTENMIVSATGVIIGSLLAVGLNILMTQLGLGRIDWLIAILGTIFVVLVGQLAVLVPAYKATLISPAQATRS